MAPWQVRSWQIYCCDLLAFHSGGSRNRDKLRPGGPLCSYPDFTIYTAETHAEKLISVPYQLIPSVNVENLKNCKSELDCSS